MKKMKKKKRTKKQLLCGKCGKPPKFGNLYRYWMNSTMILWVCFNCNFWTYSEERQEALRAREKIRQTGSDEKRIE